MRTRQMSSRGIALVLGHLLSWTVPATAQEFKGPLWGGSGGTSSYNLDCGSSGVMVGIYGKAGDWVDQIGITCQTVNANGTLGSTYTRGPKGGAGGTGATSRCLSGQVVGALYSASGTFINQVKPSCYLWHETTRRPRFSGNAETATASGIGGPPGGVLALTINHNARVRCPDEKVGKALRGRYGSYIDSLQFVCDDYNK